MSNPLIGISSWFRRVPTSLAPDEPLHALSAHYIEAVVAAGGTPVILPTLPSDRAAMVTERLDGLVISGGGDIDPARYGAENTDSHGIDPARDAWEFALVESARAKGIPLLGICRGNQVLNVACGGTLRQHVWAEATDHPPAWDADAGLYRSHDHPVTFPDGSPLADLYGRRSRIVNSLHHQAVERLGAGLEVAAVAEGGGVEALSCVDGWPALAVQWHPERMELAAEAPLFGWLVGVSARTVSAV